MDISAMLSAKDEGGAEEEGLDASARCSADNRKHSSTALPNFVQNLGSPCLYKEEGSRPCGICVEELAEIVL